MSTNLQDWVELLNAEQHVQVDKLREHARHGIAARVRGEVWLYLLNVLSEDKTAEITSLLSLNTTYQSLSSNLPSELTADLIKIALKHHTKRFRNETYAGLISSITAEQQHTSYNTNANTNSGAGTGTSGSSGLRGQSSSGSSNDQQLKTFLPPLPLSLASKIDHHLNNQSLSGTTTNFTNSANNTMNITTTTSKIVNDENISNKEILTGQLSRILPPPPSSPPSRHAYLGILYQVLGKFYNAELALSSANSTGEVENMQDQDQWVYLCTPFLCALARPVGVFLAFQKLMERLRNFPPIPSRLASFLTLFRIALPELHAYCEDEQVPYVNVALSWMTTLLSKEMWLGDVLRLWDAYLASDDMFALHCYVCVAILATCKETLEELDGSEAKLMLLDLPPMDVDRLLQDAANLRVSFPLPRPVEDD